MSAKAGKLADVQAGADLLGLALDQCPEWQPKGNGLVKTHYVPALCERNGRQRLTVCGQWVNPLTEHSAEPTCEKCRAYLLAEPQSTEEAHDEAERLFGKAV